MEHPRFEDHPTHVDALVAAILGAADPRRRVATFWPELEAQIQGYRSLYVVGAGKAALEMALELHALMGDRLTGGAVAAVPERLDALDAEILATLPFAVLPAAHPLPDQPNIIAAQTIADVARQAGEGDALIALISGGGSAHLTLPADGLSLDDQRRVSNALMQAGAPIQDLNAVRKHTEQLKGGRLLQLAAPARVYALILSDVMGDSLDVIASGPTSPDPATYADALAVLERYEVRGESEAVTAHLEAGARGDLPETLKPGDPAAQLATNTIIGSNRLAMEAAAETARATGFVVAYTEEGVEGEAREVGVRLAELARTLRDENPGRVLCTIFGGETIVTVTGSGRGGRNTEMALAAAKSLDGMRNVVVGTFATDGVDGPTDAAGAVVTGETVARARAAGLDPANYLTDNDSYTFFARLGDLIITGPTGTNVNDVAFVLVYSD